MRPKRLNALAEFARRGAVGKAVVSHNRIETPARRDLAGCRKASGTPPARCRRHPRRPPRRPVARRRSPWSCPVSRRPPRGIATFEVSLPLAVASAVEECITPTRRRPRLGAEGVAFQRFASGQAAFAALAQIAAARERVEARPLAIRPSTAGTAAGIADEPAAHRRTVRSATSSARAISDCPPLCDFWGGPLTPLNRRGGLAADDATHVVGRGVRVTGRRLDLPVAE